MSKQLQIGRAVGAILVALLVLGGAILFGCGGDDEGDTTATVLLDWKAEPTYAGVYLAKDAGEFKRRGVSITIAQGNGATTSATLIGDGSRYQIGTCSGAATAIARSKGIKVRSLAVIYSRTPTVLYSRADTPISKPADMLGKRIGLIDGSITVDEYRGVCAANGIDRASIEEIKVGWDVAPLLTKQVDGLMNYEELTPVQLRLKGHQVTTMRFREYGVNMYSLNVIVNEDAYARNPALYDTITDAIVAGYRRLRDDPTWAAKRFSDLFQERDPAFVSKSMKVVAELVGSGEVGAQDLAGWQTTINSLKHLGLLSGEVAPKKVFVVRGDRNQ